MASLTRWTWVWASSGSWWRTGKPGVLQSLGSQSQTRLSDWPTTDTGSPVHSCNFLSFHHLESAERTVKLPKIRIWSFGREPFTVGDLSSIFASWSLEQRHQTNSLHFLKCSFLLLQKLGFWSVDADFKVVCRTQSPVAKSVAVLDAHTGYPINEFAACLELELQSSRILELDRAFSLSWCIPFLKWGTLKLLTYLMADLGSDLGVRGLFIFCLTAYFRITGVIVLESFLLEQHFVTCGLPTRLNIWGMRLYQKILMRLTQLCVFFFFPVRKMMSCKQFYNKDDVFKLLE